MKSFVICAWLFTEVQLNVLLSVYQHLTTIKEGLSFYVNYGRQEFNYFFELLAIYYKLIVTQPSFPHFDMLH